MSVYDKEHLYLNFLTKIFQKSSSIPRIYKTCHIPANVYSISQTQSQNLKRKRGFIDLWSKNVDGLQDSSDGMICTYCKKFPNIAGPSSFISGNKSYRIDGIRSHFSSPKHLQCSEAYFAAQRRDNGRSN